MENITIANIIQIAAYLITIGVFVGTIKQQFNNFKLQLDAQKEFFSEQIRALEKKVEKHNNVVERLYKCEESTKSAHHRIDEMRADKHG